MKVVLPMWHDLTTRWPVKPSRFQTLQVSPATRAYCMFPFCQWKNSLDRPFLTPIKYTGLHSKMLETLTLSQISTQLWVVCCSSCIVYSWNVCSAKWNQTILLFVASCCSWQVWLVVWPVTGSTQSSTRPTTILLYIP